MADTVIPVQDGLALTWMQTFASGISASPATYLLSAADATAITAEVNLFALAYADALDPAERTPVTVATKSEARASAEALCRQYAILIKYNAGISNPDKIAIGVRPVNTSKSTIHVPGSSPLINIIGATPGAQTLRYADSTTPDSARKPFGAAQLQVFVAVGTAAVADPEQAQFYGAFTRNPIGVAFTAADDGKMATYFARWASAKGEVGPWSFPASMRIAA